MRFVECELLMLTVTEVIDVNIGVARAGVC
jgi:hypothetical protein